MIIFLSTVLAITIIFLLAAATRIQTIQKQLEELDREQHQQNKEIIELLKYRQESTEMLLQHIEILKYLCDKDPLLGGMSALYTGPIGEA